MIATVVDVQRYLNQPTLDDAYVQDFLDASEEFIKALTGIDWDSAEESVTQTFNNVRYDEILALSDRNPTDVVVRVYATADGQADELVENTSFQVLADGEIQLFWNKIVWGVPHIQTNVLPSWYDRVEVDYTPSNTVPASVREATALIAAASVKQAGLDASDLQSESIGAYSYSRRTGGTNPLTVAVPPRARMWLASYVRKARRARST